MTNRIAPRKSELTPQEYADGKGGCAFIRGSGQNGDPVRYWAGQENYTENPDDALWFKSKFELLYALRGGNQ